MKVFKIFFLSILQFCNFDFCEFDFLHFAAIGPAHSPGQIAKSSTKTLCDLCETLTREASQTCAYVPFTSRSSCCRCSVLLKRRTTCKQTSLPLYRYPHPTI
jgi:hypothetical protein